MPQSVSHSKARIRPVPVRQDFLPFTRPSIDSSDIEEVVRVLNSGWITSGEKVRQLEKRFAAHSRSGCAVAVSSATAGMHLTLHALGIGPGDEVITPSLTWVSTVNLIELSGATPVFVDVDKNTLMTSAELIEHAITPKTKLIVPVHFAGAPLELNSLRQLAVAHQIPIVEDAAHAIGTEYMRVPVGHTGTAIFSFQATKNVTTAEGGVICTDDADFAERLRRLRFHGLGADSFDRHTSGRLPTAEVLEPGYKYNLPDMNACLALGQLTRLKAMNNRRAALAARYLDALKEIEGVMPLYRPGYPHTHAWHLFVVRVDIDALDMSRDAFMAELKQRNIGTGLHFRAVHTHKYYRERYSAAYRNLANTEWNSERLLSLPLFPAMNDSDVEHVVNAIVDITSGNAK